MVLLTVTKGITPPAEEDIKTSSALRSSPLERLRTSVLNLNSSAISRTVLLVIPSKTPSLGVIKVPSLTMKTLNPGPSVIFPFLSVSIAVSNFCSFASNNPRVKSPQ